jgi:hypothetical protein
MFNITEMYPMIQWTACNRNEEKRNAERTLVGKPEIRDH